MAFETMLRQHRPHVAIEIDGETSGWQGKAEKESVACHCGTLKTP
jgi:hypothetical protein